MFPSRKCIRICQTHLLNGSFIFQFLEEMLMPSPPGLLQKMIQSDDQEVRRTAVLCIANACMK